MENKNTLFKKTSAQEIVDYLEQNNFEILSFEVGGESIDSQLTFTVNKIHPHKLAVILADKLE